MIKIKFSPMVFFLFCLDCHAKWHKSLYQSYQLNKKIKTTEFMKHRGGWDSDFERIFFISQSIKEVVDKLSDEKLKEELSYNYNIFINELKSSIDSKINELLVIYNKNISLIREINQFFNLEDISLNVYVLPNSYSGWGRASKFGILLSVGDRPMKESFKILLHEYIHFILKKKEVYKKFNEQREEKIVKELTKKFSEKIV